MKKISKKQTRFNELTEKLKRNCNNCQYHILSETELTKGMFEYTHFCILICKELSSLNICDNFKITDEI